MKSIEEPDQTAFEYRNIRYQRPSDDGKLRIRHILAQTDFSDGSLRAVNHAMGLAKRCQAQLTLLHVFNNLETPARGTKPAESGQKRQNMDRAKLRLLELYNVIRAQYPNTDIQFRAGDSQTVVPVIATLLGIDLVVI